MSLVGCEASSSAENLDTGCGSGNSAHIVLPCLAPQHRHVPADGGKRHCLSAGGAGTAQKGLREKVQNNQLLAAGVTVWGGRCKSPLCLQDAETVAAAPCARQAQGVCSLVIFQHKPRDKFMPDGAVMGKT